MKMAFSVEDVNRILKRKAHAQEMFTYLTRDHFTLKKLRAREFPFVIAGGYVASLFRNEHYNDIDVFLLNRSETLDSFFLPPSLVSKHYVFGMGDMGYHPAIIESIKFSKDPYRVNIISTKFTSLAEVLESFDYWHCRVGYDFHDDSLHVSPLAYDCIMNRRLVRTKSPYAPSQERVEKFLKAGYTYPTRTMTADSSPPVSAWHAIATYRAEMDALVYGDKLCE